MMFEFQGRTYGVFVPFLKGFWTLFVEEVSLSIASPLHRSLQGDIYHTELGQAQINEYSATFYFFLSLCGGERFLTLYPTPPTLLVLLLSLSSTSPVHGSLFFLPWRHHDTGMKYAILVKSFNCVV